MIKVKELEWEEVSTRVYDALCVGILYRAIQRHDGTAELRIDNTRYGEEHPSLKDAMYAAQTDIKVRILDALEPEYTNSRESQEFGDGVTVGKE